MANETENNDVKSSQTFDDLSQINALAEMFPEAASSEEFKGLSDIVKKVASTGSPATKETEEEEEEDEEEEHEEEESSEEEEEEEDEDDEDDSEEEDDDNPFGSSKQNKKTVDVPFSFDDKAKSFLKKRYSIDDEGKFFGSVDKWRNDSQKLNEVQESNEELLEGLQSLPENIKAAINAYANGGDYHEAFGSVDRFNFNKEFEEQDKDNVVEHYFPEKYKNIVKKLNDDEITEEDAEERINDLADAAKALYKKDKKGIEDKRAELIRNEQVKIKKIKESVSGSVKYLEKSFPNFKPAEKQRIRQILVDGNPDSIFRNKDGSYKEDAAVRIAHALHYDKLTKKAESIAKNKGASEANLDLVNKGKKKLDKGKAAADSSKKEASLKAVEHLNSHFNKDPYE